MNSKRFFVGLLSSLLLSVGLARAACSLDPLAEGSHHSSLLLSMAPDTGSENGGVKGNEGVWPPS